MVAPHLFAPVPNATNAKHVDSRTFERFTSITSKVGFPEALSRACARTVTTSSHGDMTGQVSGVTQNRILTLRIETIPARLKWIRAHSTFFSGVCSPRIYC